MSRVAVPTRALAVGNALAGIFSQIDEDGACRSTKSSAAAGGHPQSTSVSVVDARLGAGAALPAQERVALSDLFRKRFHFVSNGQKALET
ncbi:exported hypothetical protein [Candidatus Accumulibacter aalborgensis]|uniref:Uncharacterized protein n=1 Tax=Candidatus Accumulibacter aalborgensis TaxID=1860102 RepID=A0A1A8XMZ8_9PROT|nr:exported hypothetical protein [Candidatus Accumulibacter aalborgensis]